MAIGEVEERETRRKGGSEASKASLCREEEEEAEWRAHPRHAPHFLPTKSPFERERDGK